jgi:hypothetical protein
VVVVESRVNNANLHTTAGKSFGMELVNTAHLMGGKGVWWKGGVGGPSDGMLVRQFWSLVKVDGIDRDDTVDVSQFEKVTRILQVATSDGGTGSIRTGAREA